MRSAVVHAALSAAALAAVMAAAQPASDWLTDDKGVLELKLASTEKGAICGGTLRLNRSRRLVLWEGAPGAIGCKQKVEATFDDVKSVAAEERGGFTVELKSGKVRKLLLVPLPHAAWLAQQPKVQDSVATALKYGSAIEAAPGGETMTASGSAGGGGPTVKKVDVPKELAADTKKAVDAVKQALEGPAR
jgi:hypothetical protein